MTRTQLANVKQKLTSYYTPGRIVPSYGGQDRIIAFDWNGGKWLVTVQAVEEDGQIDSRWPTPRVEEKRIPVLI